MTVRGNHGWLTVSPQVDAVRKAAWARRGVLDRLTLNERRIAALRDRHQGQTGWLIGNGPSVRFDDLLRLGAEATFCCNRFYLAYDKTPFRPTYLLSTDKQMIEDFGEEMVERHPGPVLFVAEEESTVPSRGIWLRLKSRTPLEFSENIFDFVMPGGGTLVAAIQIGYFMGITRFYLYGVDHTFSYETVESGDPWRRASGDGNHFIEGYRDSKPWAPPVLWQAEGALLSCQTFLESKGGWVRNATRGGKLEVLERVDFDQVAPASPRSAATPGA